jgi:hypothetical protein
LVVVVLLSVLALSDEILAYLDGESALSRGEKSRMEIVNELCSCIHILNVSYLNTIGKRDLRLGVQQLLKKSLQA